VGVGWGGVVGGGRGGHCQAVVMGNAQGVCGEFGGAVGGLRRKRDGKSKRPSSAKLRRVGEGDPSRRASGQKKCEISGERRGIAVIQK